MNYNPGPLIDMDVLRAKSFPNSDGFMIDRNGSPFAKCRPITYLTSSHELELEVVITGVQMKPRILL